MRFACTFFNRHAPSDDMKARPFTSPWIKFVLFLLGTLGHAERRSLYARRATSGEFHHHHQRTIRADTRLNLSYELNPNLAGVDIKQMYSKQNAKLMLECSVNINFSTSIWLKNGQIVDTVLKDNSNNKRGGGGHRFLTDEKGNLHIENIRLEDDGRWQCEAEDAFGFVVTGKPIQLTVMEPPKKVYLMIDNRILDPGNPFIPVKENTELTVSCVVDEGTPKPTLSWELALGSSALADGPDVSNEVLNITEAQYDQNVGVRNDAHLGKVVRAHHNATLSCYVHHVALEQGLNVSVLLNVEYTPSFAISREPGFGIPIREGMAVSLKCDVDANPRSFPMWQKDDTTPPVQQTPDGYLNFTEIRKEHSGWYKCVAQHRTGKFSSIGYFLNVRSDEVTQEPDFDVGELSTTKKQVEVSLGGSVQLSCRPGTSGCWAKIDGQSGKIFPMGASNELRLDKVLYQEAGEYRCVSPSRESSRLLEDIRKSASFDLIIKGAPTVHPQRKNVTAKYGQSLSLSMDFCANPSFNRIFWIKNNKVYKPGDADSRVIAYKITNSTGKNCHQAVLFLTKVRTLDTGEYNFIVRSPGGLTEGTFQVNIIYENGFNIPKEDSISSSVSNYNYKKTPHIFLMCLYFVIIVNQIRRHV